MCSSQWAWFMSRVKSQQSITQLVDHGMCCRELTLGKFWVILTWVLSNFEKQDKSLGKTTSSSLQHPPPASLPRTTYSTPIISALLSVWRMTSRLPTRSFGATRKWRKIKLQAYATESQDSSQICIITLFQVTGPEAQVKSKSVTSVIWVDMRCKKNSVSVTSPVATTRAPLSAKNVWLCARYVK